MILQIHGSMYKICITQARQDLILPTRSSHKKVHSYQRNSLQLIPLGEGKQTFSNGVIIGLTTLSQGRLTVNGFHGLFFVSFCCVCLLFLFSCSFIIVTLFSFLFVLFVSLFVLHIEIVLVYLQCRDTAAQIIKGNSPPIVLQPEKSGSNMTADFVSGEELFSFFFCTCLPGRERHTVPSQSKQDRKVKVP